MITIAQNTKKNCFECRKADKQVYIYYKEGIQKNMHLVRTECAQDIWESSALRLIIGTLIDLLETMNFRIIAECPWVRAYMRLHTSIQIESKF